jgi:hypothetical protein
LRNEPNATFSAVYAISADLSTIRGDFEPNSRIQGTRFYAAAYATNLPFSVDPVYTIKSDFVLVARIATLTPP